MDLDRAGVPVFDEKATQNVVHNFLWTTNLREKNRTVTIRIIDASDWRSTVAGRCWHHGMYRRTIELRNTLCGFELAKVLTHELRHAFEPRFTLSNHVDSQGPGGYEAYYNCSSEKLARLYAEVFWGPMHRTLKDLKKWQLSQGISYQALHKQLGIIWE